MGDPNVGVGWKILTITCSVITLSNFVDGITMLWVKETFESISEVSCVYTETYLLYTN